MDKLNSRIPKTPVPIKIHEQLVNRFGPEYTLENMVLWLLERELKRMEQAEIANHKGWQPIEVSVL
jgi:hypothetical protein